MNLAIRRFRWLVRIATVLYWMLLVTATHLPPSKLPHTHVNDKVEHFTGYFLMTSLVFMSLWPSKRSTLAIAGIVLAFGLAFGAVDEWTQPPFGRSCDIRDWYADAAATGTAVVVMSALAYATRTTDDQVTSRAPAQSA